MGVLKDIFAAPIDSADLRGDFLIKSDADATDDSESTLSTDNAPPKTDEL
jgi:hypothetical protein